ncbi:MAG: MFS transporter [Anaerolineaceae bacterium]|nr:MFS transporter [Anaerolineaceae bacterium]
METAIPKTQPLARRSRATRGERWAWYFYDFGNSAYAAVVTLAVYSAYFKGQVVGGAEGSRLWGISVGIAMLVVAVLSPVLGALADFSAAKKRFLFIFTAIAVVFTAMLFFVQKGDVFTGMLFFILAEIGYRGAQVFYDSLLPDVASEEEMGRVSGNGWAIGSFGGIVCLLIVLALITTVKGAFVVRLSFIITAVFYAVSTIPTFLKIREKSQPQTLKRGETYFVIPFRRLVETIKAAREYKEFIKFMIAFLIYNDGIMMTLDFAAIIGAVLFGMDQQQLIIFMILVQITSVIGAFAFGYFAERFGSKLSLAVSIVLMIITVSGLLIVDSLAMFNVLGAMAGFALTGVQSVSRTMVGQMAPPNKAAEFYGFFSIAGRTSSFIGPTLYGLVAASAAVWYAGRGYDAITAEQHGLRVAVLLIIVFLVVGLSMLMFVRQKRHMASIQAEA